MNRQLSFQERREAFAARRGRFVDMHEDDDSSSLRSPVASVTASFDTLASGRLGLVICACLQPPLAQPPCPPIPSRPSRLRRASCLPPSSGQPPRPPILPIHRPRKLRLFLGQRPTRMMRISLSVSASPRSFVSQGLN